MKIKKLIERLEDILHQHPELNDASTVYVNDLGEELITPKISFSLDLNSGNLVIGPSQRL